MHINRHTGRDAKMEMQSMLERGGELREKPAQHILPCLQERSLGGKDGRVPTISSLFSLTSLKPLCNLVGESGWPHPAPWGGS